MPKQSVHGCVTNCRMCCVCLTPSTTMPSCAPLQTSGWVCQNALQTWSAIVHVSIVRTRDRHAGASEWKSCSRCRPSRWGGVCSQLYIRQVGFAKRSYTEHIHMCFPKFNYAEHVNTYGWHCNHTFLRSLFVRTIEPRSDMLRPRHPWSQIAHRNTVKLSLEGSWQNCQRISRNNLAQLFGDW